MSNNQTAPSQPNPVVIPSSNDSNKKGLWLIVGIVVVAVIGGAYWYLNKSQQTPVVTNTAPQVNQPTKIETSLDQDLEAIQAEASDSSEFDSVDQDLKNL